MKKESLAIIGAVFTALLSTLCCLPALLFLVFGMSTGVLAYFTTLEYTRIPLAILTIALFLYGLQRYRARISCKCDNKTLFSSYLIFFCLFVLLVFLLFYPELIPLFMD